jgi:hypothetical protein
MSKLEVMNADIEQEILTARRVLKAGVPNTTAKQYQVVTYFLEVSSYLLDYVQSLRNSRAEVQCELDSNMYEVYRETEGSVALKKEAAKADSDTQNYERELAQIDAEIARMTGYVKLFEHAHLTFRMSIRD